MAALSAPGFAVLMAAVSVSMDLQHRAGWRAVVYAPCARAGPCAGARRYWDRCPEILCNAAWAPSVRAPRQRVIPTAQFANLRGSSPSGEPVRAHLNVGWRPGSSRLGKAFITTVVYHKQWVAFTNLLWRALVSSILEYRPKMRAVSYTRSVGCCSVSQPCNKQAQWPLNCFVTGRERGSGHPPMVPVAAAPAPVRGPFAHHGKDYLSYLNV